MCTSLHNMCIRLSGLQCEKEKAVIDCTKAIELNPPYVKALQRRAKLHEELDQLDRALEDYKELNKLEPNNPEAKAALITLPKRIEEQTEKLKKEMFGTEHHSLCPSGFLTVFITINPTFFRQNERFGQHDLEAIWSVHRQLPNHSGSSNWFLLCEHDQIDAMSVFIILVQLLDNKLTNTLSLYVCVDNQINVFCFSFFLLNLCFFLS